MKKELSSLMLYGNSMIERLPPRAIVLINSPLAENTLLYLQLCEVCCKINHLK